MILRDIDDAIDSILNPSTASSLTTGEDEFQRWKRSEPAAERGTEYADNPIKYWVSMRDCYPSLSKVANNQAGLIGLIELDDHVTGQSIQA